MRDSSSPSPMMAVDEEAKTESFMEALRKSAAAEEAKRKRPPTKSRYAKREMVPLEKPPPAAEAAFAGPPRYDWIDIVSHYFD